MISPIVVCRVAPMVRHILTKSYTPATLCTVSKRTSQQSEEHLYRFSFSPKHLCLTYLAGLHRCFFGDELLSHHIGLTT